MDESAVATLRCDVCAQLDNGKALAAYPWVVGVRIMGGLVPLFFLFAGLVVFRRDG